MRDGRGEGVQVDLSVAVRVVVPVRMMGNTDAVPRLVTRAGEKDR